MRRTVHTLLACTILSSMAATAEPVDPAVPRALTELNRLGTPASILERTGIAAAALLDVTVHVDSIVQVGIHTRGAPAVHVSEPLYLPDRVRLRAEVQALPAGSVIAPAPGGKILDFSVKADSAAGATVITIDLPRVAWGRVAFTPDLTTIRLATDRVPGSAPPQPIVLPDSTRAQRAGVIATELLQTARSAAVKTVRYGKTAAQAMAAQVVRIAGNSRLAQVQPDVEALGLPVVAMLSVLLFVMRLRRHRPRHQSVAARPRANPWVVQTLAYKGARVRDIAVQTGMPREAVTLVMRLGGSVPRTAERAASGRNFPATLRADRLSMRLAG